VDAPEERAMDSDPSSAAHQQPATVGQPPAATPSPGLRLPAGLASAVKLVVLGFLVLVLLLPISSLVSLVRERQARQAAVAREIAASWGGEQTLLGPVLALVYNRPHRVERFENGRTTITLETYREVAFLLPETASLRGQLAPELRARGIFEVVVWSGDLAAEGTFRLPSAEELGDPAITLRPGESRLAVGISDVRALVRGLTLQAGSQEIPFEPGAGEASEVVEQGISARLDELALGATLPWRFSLALRGTERLHVLPAGVETTLELTSSWPSPSFSGAFLPLERELRPDGFTARWVVPYYGRGVPQRWVAGEDQRTALAASTFGVTLVRPADGYQRSERAVKYAALFVVLTFGLLFLLELVSPERLHPAQYLLVGFALCLFFLLLLALSEQLSFARAYGLAAAAVTVLVTGYTRAVLASTPRAALAGGALAVLYGYLYVLLQLADLSLLFGAIGLFTVLATLMWATRRLDWYQLRFRSQ
jgi:inner membrane protein